MREENQSSKLTKLKANLQKLMKKRWALPAVYLGVAALVLSSFIWFTGADEEMAQNDADVDVDYGEYEDTDIDANYDDALPVTTTNEVFKMPVVNDEEVNIIGYFFDFNAPEEEQQAALVLYDNTYYQSEGIDLAMESGETFDVVAALSGTVVRAEKDALFGNVVHIEHGNNVVTVYQSLEGLKVEAGETVKQGDVLGQAGRSLYNKDAGVHVHFAIQQEGVAVNPMDYFNQSVSSLSSDATEEVVEDELDGEDDKDDEEDVDDDSSNKEDVEEDQEEQ